MMIGIIVYVVAWIISLIILARQDISSASSTPANLYLCPCNEDYRVRGNIGLLLLIVALLPFTFLIGLHIANKMKKHKKSCLVKIVDDVTNVK